VDQQLALLFGLQVLLVGGTAQTRGPGLLVVTLGIIIRDSAPKVRLQDVTQSLLVAVPRFHLHRSRDRLGLGENVLEGLLQFLGVRRRRDPEEVLGPAGLALGLLVLVEGQVRGPDKPRDTGLPEFLLPTSDCQLVVCLVQLPRLDDAIRRDHGYADNRVPVGLGLQELAGCRGDQSLARGGTFRARWRLAAMLRTTIVQFVGEIDAGLTFLALFADPGDEVLTLAL